MKKSAIIAAVFLMAIFVSSAFAQGTISSIFTSSQQPSVGNNFNPLPTRDFFAGGTIYHNVEYICDSNGVENFIYYVLNTDGQIQYIHQYTGTCTSGQSYAFWFPDTEEPGTYFFNVLVIFSNGNIFTAPISFPYTVF